MSVFNVLANMLAKGTSKTSSYDSSATVTRVEGNTIYVHIPGGVPETPVKKTVNAKVGDVVQVRVGGGHAWITGNATNPPTDDTEANRAQTMARSAAQRAQLAVDVADEAGVAAEEAVQQSDEAIQQASASLMTDTLHYLATSASSGVTINTPGWTDTPQSIDSSKRYLWTYHTYTKVSGATSNTQPVISGVYGQTGATITSVTELYALNDDSDSPPADNAFSANWSPPTASNRYLWNMEQITYSDSTTSYTAKHILLTYTPGIQGRGIASITEYYALSTAAVEPATSDFSTTVPTMTSTSKYMWNYEVIAYTDGLNPTTTDKRIIGVYGDTGLTGKSLTGITEYYALSNSSTTEPADNDFSTTVQNPTASSKYVWNYELMTWNDNGTTSTTRTDKRVVAVYGDKGNTGKALTGITEYYARNNSTSAPADNAFSTSVTQPTASYKYVWNFERLTWNDNGTTSTTDTAKHIVAVYGDKGDQGVSITSVQPQYYLSTSASEPTGGSWGTTLNWTTGKYIWTRDLITYSNNSTSTSTPVYNSALTSACINAANAYAIAQDTNQYFWHTESGTDTGTHITEVSQSDFESDPQNAGGNLLARSNGVAIRKGLTELATLTGSGLNIANENGVSLANFGTTARVGRANSTRFVMNAGSLQAYDDTNTMYFEVSPTGLSFGDFDAAATSDIPTKVSDLTNDKNYATTTQVGAAKSEAISAAATDATNKANAAQSAAATDATSKANEAAKTATTYITAIDNNGIRVHASNNPSSNYARLNADGMQVYKGGAQRASFGADDITLGGDDSGNARAILKYRQDGSAFGLPDSRRVVLSKATDESGYRNDATLSSRELSTFANTKPMAFANVNHKVSGSYKYGEVGLYAWAGDSSIVPAYIILTKGTTDSVLGKSNALVISAGNFSIAENGNISSTQINSLSSNVTNLLGDVDDLESGFSTLSGVVSSIGDIVAPSASGTSVPKTGAWTSAGPQLQLTKGVWVITASAKIPSFGSSTTRKGLRIYNTSDSTACDESTVQVDSSINAEEHLSTTAIVSLSATKNFKAQGWLGTTASSAVTFTINIKAVRIK